MATREADALEGTALAHRRQRWWRPAFRPPSHFWKAAMLYAGVPAGICLYATLNNWKLLEAVGFLPTLGFYAAHAMVPWTITAVLTHLAWQGLRPWRPGIPLITLVGAVAGCLLTIPYASWITGALESNYGVTAAVSGLPIREANSEWSRILGSMVRTYLIWVGINLLFDRYLGYPRYRYEETPAPEPGPSASGSPVVVREVETDLNPVFMSRLSKPASLATLVAIHAEQHYIQVITDTGQELVLYRLSDAVNQLPESLGIQVHRSWWVSRRAIREVHSQGKRMSLKLSNGMEVPVSAPYQALARSAAAHAH